MKNILQYFKCSFLLLILGTIFAYFWGNYIHSASTSGLQCVFIVIILSILEISLSFDNAVVNACKLDKMDKIWQERFLTIGIFIAVFGMRLLFPILIVSIFSHLSIIQTTHLAIYSPEKYSYYLHLSHNSILIFGAMFLLMLFLHYILDINKKIHWIKFIESKIIILGNIQGIETIIALTSLVFIQHFLPNCSKLNTIVSGISGIALYLLIHGLSVLMEKQENKVFSSKNFHKNSFKSGLIGFLYLELIDASFSLDGVLGAFALTKDIIIITIGLAIGAMFVRSLTIMMVDKKTLQKFVFLEHGAHWAIGALALIMMLSTIKPIADIITGLIGFSFILLSFISSLYHNKMYNCKHKC